MLRTDVDMGSPDRTFEHGPERFQRIHVNLAPRVFLAPMIDHVMVVPQIGEDTIRHPFVGTDRRARRAILLDRGNERLTAGIRDDLGKQFPAPLKDAEYDSLVRAPASDPVFLPALDLAADVSLVSLDMAS